MKDSNQVAAEFRADLRAVLGKWQAEIEVEHDSRGHDGRMVVTIPAIYENNEAVREWTTVDLGWWLNHDKPKEHP